MNKNSTRIQAYHLAIILGLSLFMLFPQTLVMAKPGTLSTIPLYLSTGVDSNFVFLTDDSGSMDWTLMTSEPNGIMYLYYGYFYTHPAPDNDYFWIVATEEELLARGEPAPAGGVWRGWFSGYNRIYYNPAVTYTPWKGVDNTGATYANSTPTATRYNPYNLASGTVDLTATTTYSTDYGLNPSLGFFTVNNFHPARYYTWTDTDADGVVDADDAHTLIEIKPATPTYTGSTNRTDCTFAPSCSYAEELQNFANWFSYYRKREYVAKNAVTAVITPMVDSRVAFGTINNVNNVKIGVAAMNADVASGNKRTLFDRIFQSNSAGSTPLRSNLRDVGKYFECVSGNLFDASGASCPILDASDGGMCQQNFTILMTDGYYNGSAPSIGDADSDNNTSYDGGDYADSNVDSLADVAMHYYERDLDSSLADLVPITPGIDDAAHQHMVTFTVAFGVTGSLDPFDTKTPGVNSDTLPSDPAFNWTSTGSNAGKIDDLWHTAYNGRGIFVSANNPEDLTKGLDEIVGNAEGRDGTSAAVAFNTTTLSTNTNVYLARFSPSTWSGDLFAYDLDHTTGEVSTKPNEDSAASMLDGQTPSTRQIISYNDDTSSGVAFRTLGALSTKQQNDLNMGPSAADGLGQARIDYLRGSRVDEGTGNNFRVRTSVLGDIVHSNPVYVGKPQLNYPDSVPELADYSNFKTTHINRAGVVYVGSNDGLLHAFSETNLTELFAYVPNILFDNSSNSGLHYLTDPGYTHRYYVDSSPTVSDIKIAGAWKTVLIGALRGGGRGLFALDITDPTALTEANASSIALWEFSSSDDPDLGYTFSKPTMAYLSNGKWAAIVGNGYNSSGDGLAHLFIIYFDGTPTIDVVISTGDGSPADPNGLSTPGIVDSNFDGIADYAYAGDLYGDLWKFDLSSIPPTVSRLFDGTPTQPITTKPVIAIHPTETGNPTKPNLIVYFGTGQYIVNGDISSTASQTMYGIWDGNQTNVVPGDLEAQSVSLVGSVRVVEDDTFVYGSNGSKKMGWMIDLPTIGERIIVNPKVRGDFVFFNTMIPDTDVCLPGGSGWLMAVKLINGGTPDDALFDINNDGEVDDDDLVDILGTPTAASGIQFTEGIPAESTYLGDKIYTPGSTGQIVTTEIDVCSGGCDKSGRLSWREIIN